MSGVLDLRTQVAPGGRETFDRIFREGALPMLDRHEIDVVGYGPSLADKEHYYLACAFASLGASSSSGPSTAVRVAAALRERRDGAHRDVPHGGAPADVSASGARRQGPHARVDAEPAAVSSLVGVHVAAVLARLPGGPTRDDGGVAVRMHDDLVEGE